MVQGSVFRVSWGGSGFRVQCSGFKGVGRSGVGGGWGQTGWGGGGGGGGGG